MRTMDFLGNAINALVVAVAGLLLAWFAKGQVGALKETLGMLKETFESRFQAMDGRIDRLETRIDGLQTSLDSMRSDLMQVALAVGARPRAGNR